MQYIFHLCDTTNSSNLVPPTQKIATGQYSGTHIPSAIIQFWLYQKLELTSEKRFEYFIMNWSALETPKMSTAQVQF